MYSQVIDCAFAPGILLTVLITNTKFNPWYITELENKRQVR